LTVVTAKLLYCSAVVVTNDAVVVSQRPSVALNVSCLTYDAVFVV